MTASDRAHTPIVVNVRGAAGRPSSTNSTSVPDVALLDRSLARGLIWTGGARWAAQLVSWSSTFVVARLLSPEDYGLVGLATVYLGFVRLISEFGLGVTVVTLRELSESQIAQLNTLAVLIGLAGFLISCVAAVPLGHFFSAPSLPAVIIAMSLTFVIGGFRTVPLSLLQRDHRFKLLALLDAGQALAVGVSAISLVLLGLGYWTLVFVMILGAGLGTASVLVVRRSRFARPRFANVRQATTLSRHVLVSRLASYIYTDAADSLVAGKLLGTAALGSYNLAFTVATLPVEKVTTLIGGVVPSVLSAVQRDTGPLRRYLLVLSEGIALITFPATLGLALLARPLVLVVLGDKWEAMIAPVQWLAVYGTVQSVAALLTHVLVAVRDTRFLMWWNIVALVVLPTAFVIGSQWGVAGIAAAWMVVHPPLLVPLYARTFARLEIYRLEYIRALTPALTATGLMLIAVWLSGVVLPRDESNPALLGARVFVGAAVYITVLVLLYRERLRPFLRAAAELRR